jgi:hypothetical protein
VQKAAFWLSSQGFRNEIITIHSDSQACLAALESITVKSSPVQDCIEALNLVGNCNKLHLRWVKAHVGIHGNEMAYLLAKRGTTLGTGPIPAVNLKTPLNLTSTRSGKQCGKTTQNANRPNYGLQNLTGP